MIKNFLKMIGTVLGGKSTSYYRMKLELMTNEELEDLVIDLEIELESQNNFYSQFCAPFLGVICAIWLSDYFQDSVKDYFGGMVADKINHALVCLAQLMEKFVYGLIFIAIGLLYDIAISHKNNLRKKLVAESILKRRNIRYEVVIKKLEPDV